LLIDASKQKRKKRPLRGCGGRSMASVLGQFVEGAVVGRRRAATDLRQRSRIAFGVLAAGLIVFES
jgi:hypothetical protein